jgi:hypothetical protein
VKGASAWMVGNPESIQKRGSRDLSWAGIDGTKTKFDIRGDLRRTRSGVFSRAKTIELVPSTALVVISAILL